MATAEVRVTVSTGTGAIVARGRAPLPSPSRPRPGWSEQDARAWWPAVVSALGEPIGPAVMYDDRRVPATERWRWLLDQDGAREVAAHAWHAADLIVAGLTGDRPPTDWSHALKTGFDPEAGDWTAPPAPTRLLPEVLPPTSPAGTVTAWAASRTGLPTGCQVRLGMTDACAAQVAAGADHPGRFVTILGTTL